MARYSANCSGCGKPIGSGHTRWCPVRRRLAAGLAAALLLLCVGRAAAQDVALTVQGGKVVKVEMTVTILVEATVIDRLPFTVTAPADDNALYFWTWPSAVSATKSRNSLEVSGAPKGELKLGVEIVTPRLDKDGRFQGYITKVGTVTVFVGDVPGPGPAPVPPDPKPPPVPPEPPVDTFTKELQAAYDREPAAGKSRAVQLRDACAMLAAAADNAAYKTTLDLRNVFAKEVAANVAPALPAVRGVVVRRLDRAIPVTGTASDTLTPALRAQIAAEFRAIAEALGRVK